MFRILELEKPMQKLFLKKIFNADSIGMNSEMPAIQRVTKLELTLSVLLK